LITERAPITAARLSQRPDRSGAGFSLLEVLVALALLGVALLLDLGLQAQSREIDARLAAETELSRRAEAVIESVRAGVHPLRSGPVDPDRAWPIAPESPLSMILDVDLTDVSGLCRLVVRGHARGRRGRPHEVQLETLIYQPGSPCR
jgi:prepilin-type N-terminal cleavage/methylation domain-containing protein